VEKMRTCVKDLLSYLSYIVAVAEKKNWRRQSRDVDITALYNILHACDELDTIDMYDIDCAIRRGLAEAGYQVKPLYIVSLFLYNGFYASGIGPHAFWRMLCPQQSKSLLITKALRLHLTLRLTQALRMR
jgi:hypothetical protein